MSEENEILEQEIFKIRKNAVLIKSLDQTCQFMTVNPLTMKIEFLENMKLRPNYNKDQGRGILVQPITGQHLAQHQDLSELI